MPHNTPPKNNVPNHYKMSSEMQGALAELEDYFDESQYVESLVRTAPVKLKPH